MLELDISLARDRFVLRVQETLNLSGIWAIMGPSGCGKTSLLRCLAGLERQALGSVCFRGQVWQDSDSGSWMPPEKRRIGYIFQDARLFTHLDVMGNLRFAEKRARPTLNVPALNDVIQQLAVEPLLARSIEKLSGGEKQRVAIARTLLNAPSILLMDEPLASLDWQAKTEILPLLRNVYKHFQIPIIMVSHAHEEVARLADSLLMLNRGQVTNRGRCRTLIMQHAFSDDRAALAMLEGKVIRHCPEHSLTELDVCSQTLWINQMDNDVGSHVRVVLPAQEVSVCLNGRVETSIQNRLLVTVEQIRNQGLHHCLLILKLKKQRLLSIITKKSLGELSLQEGRQVFAYFKASGLDVY